MVLGFQLNTLDFSATSTMKNIFWKKSFNMIDDSKFDVRAMEHLVQLFSFAHDAQQKGIYQSRQKMNH